MHGECLHQLEHDAAAQTLQDAQTDERFGVPRAGTQDRSDDEQAQAEAPESLAAEPRVGPGDLGGMATASARRWPVLAQWIVEMASWSCTVSVWRPIATLLVSRIAVIPPTISGGSSFVMDCAATGTSARTGLVRFP